MSALETKITIGRSRELFAAHLSQMGVEVVELKNARGRVLAETLCSDRDLPPFDRVTMDGIAVKWDAAGSANQWTCVGTQFAGDKPLTLEHASQCVEIMTGAKLPNGADTVIPVEWIDSGSAGQKLLREGETVEMGQFVHLTGSDSRAGDRILEPGVVMRARQLALAASVGRTRLQVRRLPRVAYVSTGNELVAVHRKPGEAEVRRSNDQVLIAECAKAGIELSDNLHLRDNPQEISDHLEKLRAEVDVIVFSGGVSMGKADYIPGCAQGCGFELVFHKVKQKPGGPILFGKHPDGTVLLGLPGNPLSCMVCARVYLREVFERLSGYPVGRTRLRVKGPFPDDQLKARFQPVKIMEDAEWCRVGTIVQPNTSGDIISVLKSDGIVELPITQERESENLLVLEYLDWEL